MTIFDQLFGKKQNQEAQQQQQGQQQNPNAGQHVNNNPTVPNDNNQMPQNNNQQPGDQSPNAKFADLWQNPVNAPGNAAPNFRLNPEALAQRTAQMDFAKNVNQADLQKVAQGGEEAVQALSNILNDVGRNVFGMTAQFASHMTESGYNVAQQSIDRGLPDIIRKQMSQQELMASNPKLKDPALAPVVSAIQTQMSMKYPNATPAELNGMVAQYFESVVGPAFAKESPASAQQKANPAMDFSGFLN